MRFLIESVHEVYEDSFTEGEGALFSSYIEKQTVYAASIDMALVAYYRDTLHYALRVNSLNYEDDYFIDSTLVDEDLCELSDAEITKWRNGELNAYSDSFKVTIYILGKVCYV